MTLYLRWLFRRYRESVTTPMIITRKGGNREPDFLVEEGADTYGVEEARASTFLFQRAIDALRGKGPSAFIDAGPHLSLESGPEYNSSFDVNSVDQDELICTSGEVSADDPCLGLDAEAQWAEIVAYRIRQKLIKLEKRYTKTVPKCDLLLYSIPVYSIRELDAAVELLRMRIEAIPGKGSPSAVAFRRVSIVCEDWAIFDALRDDCKIVARNGWPNGS